MRRCLPYCDHGFHLRSSAAHKELGEWRVLIDDCTQLINLKPRTASHWHSRGLAHYMLGHWHDAVEDYNKVIELDHDNGPIHNDLAWFLLTCPDMKARNPARGLQLSKRANELMPVDPSVWNTLGVAYYRNGEWQLAIDAFNKAISLRKSGNSFDWFFMAMANWRLGNEDEARRWHEEAIQWADENMHQLPEFRARQLRQFRAEAEEMLQGK